MLSHIIPKRYASALLKHVVAVSLFIPYMHCKDYNFYYQEFILANFFAILSMIFILTSWQLDLRKNGILLAGMGILLIAYNVAATYMNYNYHHWYGEQINTTISFLFFMVLLMIKDPHALFDKSMIRSIIHMMVTTNVLAIGYRLITGQNRILFLNNYVRLDKYEGVMEPQYSWLYIHKSQYALILVVCIAFCVVYRKMFRNIVTYLMSLGVLLFSLYLSDTYTSMVSATLIFVGQFIDYLWRVKWWKRLTVAFVIGIPGIICWRILYKIIGEERDLFTLGGRLQIWKGSLKPITKYPNGWTEFVIGINRFKYGVDETGQNMWAYNCHNVFLNHMFRYSILVGGIFLLIISLLLLFSIKRKPSFLTLGICCALLIPLCMDYSMTTLELTIVMLFLFVFFFIDKHSQYWIVPDF